MSNFMRSSNHLLNLANIYRRIAYIPHSRLRLCQLSLVENALPHTRYFQTSYVLLNDPAPAVSSSLRSGSTLSENVKASSGVSDSQHSSIDSFIQKLDADAKRTGRLSRRDVTILRKHIDSEGNATSMQGLLLIRCCGALMFDTGADERTAIVMDIWSSLQKQGCIFDVSHYNSLLKVHLENEYKFDPIDFLANMEANKIEPNRVTYQRLIARYCRHGDIQGASKILEFMKSKSLPVNEHIFNELIIGHAKSGDMDEAAKILDVMREANFHPSSSTFCALACGHAIHGDLPGIFSTLQDAEDKDAQLSFKELLDVIYTLTVNNHGHLVEQVLPKLEERRIVYNDINSVMIELLKRGYNEIAYSLVCLMDQRDRDESKHIGRGQLFIQQLVKLNMPKEVIVDYCEKMISSGLNRYALYKVVHVSLVDGQNDNALFYLRKLHSMGAQLRPHYFWPLILEKKNINDSAVYDLLKLMGDFNCYPDISTILDYVLPNIDMTDVESVLLKLKDTGVETFKAVGTICNFLLQKNDISSVIRLLEKYPVKLSPLLVPTHKLAAIYERSGDAESIAKIVYHLVKNPLVNGERKTGEDICGAFLQEYYFEQRPTLEKSLNILVALKKMNLGISDLVSTRIVSRVSKFSEKESTLLHSLVNPDVVGEEVRGINPRIMSLTELEGLLVERKAKRINNRDVLRSLLVLYAKDRNIARLEEILQELDAMNFIYSGANYCVLMNTYAVSDKVEKAMHYKKLLDESYPNFVPDFHKIVNLATALVKSGHLKEAEQIITNHMNKFYSSEAVDSLGANFMHLMTAVCDRGDLAQTRKFLDLILSSGWVQPSNILFGSLMKAHIMNNDINGAVEEFVNVVNTYRFTPYKNELCKVLIQKEDSEQLQKVVDAAMLVHDENSILADLACSFIECGRTAQAKKIMQTPGMKINKFRLESIGKRFVQINLGKELEVFIDVSKDVFELDRERLYYHLLRFHANAGNVEKALGVWVTMQEENVQPTECTLHFLGTFLEHHKQPVPFSMPENKYHYLYDKPTTNRTRLAPSVENVEPAVLAENSSSTFHSAEELFEKLEADNIDLMKIFPGNTFMTLLSCYPEKIDEAKVFAEKYYEKGFPTGRNLIWISFMLQGKFSEAEEILKSTPEMKNGQLLMRSIITKIKLENNETLSKELLRQLVAHRKQAHMKGFLYSIHISTLVNNNNLDAALQCLKEAESNIPLSTINKQTLISLQIALKKAGKSVPIQVTEILPGLPKGTSSSSSDYEK